jgi:hypothetical protein
MADESLDIQIKLLADTYGAEKVQSALKQIKGETEGLTIKHQELRAAVRGLHTEFPELARIAHLALHPIGLAVAAIGGSFAVWKMRTEELQATFANLALPDIKALDVGHINAVTEAWGKYNKALGTAIENAHSVEKDTEKALKSIETRIEATNKLIEAFAGKKQAGASGILEKLGISEQETIDKSIIDKRADNLKLGEKEREIANLGIESVNKRREGAKIRVASAEDDAKTTEALKAAAEIAKKDIDERKQKIGVLRARQAGALAKVLMPSLELSQTSRAAYPRHKPRLIFTIPD